MKEKILIVDDEPHIRRILKFLLEQQGYQVLSASNGKEGLEQAQTHQPDLIMLDLMMPQMDGYKVCEHLRADFRTSQIPVIMVTAKGEVNDRVRGLEGGANDYLTKPYDNKELLVRVRNMLDWSRSQRQANPLTGLPGNRAIEAELQNRIALAEPFSFMYLDIDNFKAFNDHYGYSRGDELIQMLAAILRSCSLAEGSENDFIGHIGGDDFCLITNLEASEKLAHAFVDRFDEQILQLVEPKDREQGYLEVRSRQGGVEHVPLPSLTVALVCDQGGSFPHWAKVSDVAAELKNYGKSKQGSVVVKERRDVGGAMQPVLTREERR